MSAAQSPFALIVGGVALAAVVPATSADPTAILPLLPALLAASVSRPAQALTLLCACSAWVAAHTLSLSVPTVALGALTAALVEFAAAAAAGPLRE